MLIHIEPDFQVLIEILPEKTSVKAWSDRILTLTESFRESIDRLNCMACSAKYEQEGAL